MGAVTLRETSHPSPDARSEYDSLFGLDRTKQDLQDALVLILSPGKVESWQKKHHPKPPPLLAQSINSARLIVLSGEVGCGKSALAGSVATPVAEACDDKVLVLETPSDIRGQGLVGELSARITSAFDQAVAKARKQKVLLVIDEGDDLATSRAQMQAHHEDRAGVNVLVRQIDMVTREKLALAVILITNRPEVLDSAVLRRAGLHLRFDRPSKEARTQLFAHLLGESSPTQKDLKELAAASERDGLAFTYSDITKRALRHAVQKSVSLDAPLDVGVMLECLREIDPTPTQNLEP